MQPIFLLPFLFLTCIATAQTDLQKGLSWYGERTEGAVGVQAQREPIEKAIQHLHRAVANPQQQLEATLYLCRSYIFKGRFVETESKQRSKSLETAKEIAETLLEKHPTNIELHFEYLAALGLWGESIGILRAAKEGIATKMREACETMILLDPEFMNGVGKRSLGVLNYKVPAIPFIISWPDKNKSMVLLSEVMARYPDDLANNFYYAEALYVTGQKEKAQEYLQRTLSFVPAKEHLLEHRLMHLEAKKLMEKLRSK